MTYPAQWRHAQMEVWAKILTIEKEQLVQNERILNLLERVFPPPKLPTHATLQQVGDPMNPLAPGQAGIKFQMTLLPAGYDQPQSVAFEFTSDDSLVSFTSDTSDITGSTANVLIDPTDAPLKTVNMSCHATGINKDGSVLDITTTTAFAIVAAPPPPSNNPTSGSLAQVA